MSNLKVLISGASVAGPIAAYWFAKAGAQVTIVERFPSLRDGGQNIDIRSVGVTVMRRMEGLEAAVRNTLAPIDGFTFVHADGTPFASMTGTGNPDQQSILSEYEIFRGDLSRILYDMTHRFPNVNYVFGEQIASLEQRTNSMRATFTNSLPPSDYDLVVSCDGSTSRTRALGLNCAVRDHIRPFNAWAAYFSMPGDLLHGKRAGLSHSAVGGRFMALGPDRNSVTRATLIHTTPSGTLPFREAKAAGDDALKAHIARVFRGAGWQSEAIIAGMHASADFYASELVQVRMPVHYKGNFALVGDAGYAPGPIGTGTSLAMAGAYILAGEVCSRPHDVAAGLRAYEERMAPLIKDMQAVPPGIPGLLAPQTAWGIWMRNVLFRLVAWGARFQRALGWLTGWFSPAFKGDGYGLPEYEFGQKRG